MQLITQEGQGGTWQQTALALGYFDGIHQGHRAVIGATVAYAKENKLCPAVFTFLRNNPTGIGKKSVMDETQKLAILEELGVDICFEPEFESFCKLTPRQFFQQYLVEKYHAKALFCGENYGFGAKRAGDTVLLAQLCEEFGVHLQVLPLAQQDKKAVSSSRIRTALAKGNVDEAHTLLCRPYELCLPVQHGKGLGKTFGFPTINQMIPKQRQQPAFGVYITSTYLDEKWYPSATGYGTRPTLAGEEATCETFIPGYEGDVYGKTVCVRFYKRLANTQKFDTVEALAAAVQSWAAQAQAYFSNTKT